MDFGKSKTRHKSRKAPALRYAARGWPVVPLYSVEHGTCACASGRSCAHPGKHPRTANGVHNATTNRKRIKAWLEKWPKANFGIATGRRSGIFVLDVDGKIGKASLETLQDRHGRLPKTITVETGKGRHLYFRCGGARVRNSAGRLGKGIDVRGDGGYVVAAGSVHSSGAVYRYRDGRGLGGIEVASAPKWLIDLVSAPKATDSVEAEPTAHPIPAADLDRARAYADAARRRELDRLGKAPNHQRNDTLNLAAFKLGQFLPYSLFDSASAASELARVAAEVGLDDHEIGPTIRSGLKAGSQYPRRLPFLKSRDRIRTVERPKKSDDDLAADLAALGETDTDNAQRFARRFGAKAIHTPGRGWLVYDGKRWRRDDLLQVTELAKQTARLIADEAQHLDIDAARAARSKFAAQSLGKGALDRMLDLAKSLLAVEDDRLDADAWLLNVENGTIDLRTGRREKHDPRDLLTKITPVRANRSAKCPLFKKFLRRITGGDAGLRTFIQKAVGYSLTGSTTEQAFFFVHGKSGNNGKSTLVNLIRDMLGDYGCHTPTETLLTKQYDNNIPADLARLAGARMVTAIEANFNRHLDEAKIKAMTGGEPIVARFMRQNFFPFVPEFKLWLVANDRPRVRGTDDAFWRRVRVIPLDITIPSAERDLDLPTKLRAEWSGILAWAVRGCRRWQASGLDQPTAVRSATKGWQQEMDALKAFVAEQLIIASGYKIPSSQLFDRYKKWCADHGEEPLTVQDFKAKLQESLDVTHTRTKGRSWWRGIKFQD
jgi:putative DNA primase/helicase